MLLCISLPYANISAAAKSSPSKNASPASMELHSGWRFRQARLTNWYPATVPGVVHTDLMSNGIIEDPFFRLNERGLQWIDKEDWIYETEFDLPAEIFAKENIFISFDGLDTYADVYLNDEKILIADNMFRRWSVDIKGAVKEKGNLLRVYFHSPVKVDMPKFDSLPFRYNADNDQSENGGLLDKKISIFARKAGYHYGWDWGPRLVTSGIWRPVNITGWNDARIGNVQVIQNDVSSLSANVKVIVEVVADKDINGAAVSIYDEDGNRRLGNVKASLKKGLNRVEVEFTMKEPRLWWTNGLGKPHLYTFRTEVAKGRRTLDAVSERIGIRSLELVREDDEWGGSFRFVLNGQPVFCKGANYIPCDNFLPRVTKEIYERTVKDAVDVNMNMLRVWGGGTYEDDYFYDLCDENGILVWQDFMFACAMYPAEGALLENIRQEAIDNVRRLRNHPSIAIWCGNNECQDAWLGWGWKRRLENQNPEYAALVWKQFEDQYFRVLPEVVAEHGSGIEYTPTSPFAGKGVKSNDHRGDFHYWGVWHGKEPISQYNEVRSRFFSEYGFQSFPAFETVKKYAPEEEDWDIYSEVMMSHQRGGAHANGLIESYLLSEYHKPKDFRSFLYMGQVLQGDVIKTAIEAHRRDKGYCWGTLFWQHNDCWPVASWSSRDWYGVWKAQHYFSRQAYGDILVSPVEKDGVLYVYVVSDRLEDVDATLAVEVVPLGNHYSEVNTLYDLTVKANSSNMLFSKSVDDLLKMLGHNGQSVARGDVVIHVELTIDNHITGDENGAETTDSKEVYTNNYFLCQQKDMNYPEAGISHSIRPVEGGYEVTVSADRFARAVYLSIDGTNHFFSDNYFDLLPLQPHTVTVSTSLDEKQFAEQLKIISLVDAY